MGENREIACGAQSKIVIIHFRQSHHEMLIAKTVNGAPARSFKLPKLSLPKNTLAKHPTNGRCSHPMAIPNQPKLIADEIFRDFVMRLITLIDCWFDFRIDHKTLGILMISCLHRIRNRTATMHPNRNFDNVKGACIVLWLFGGPLFRISPPRKITLINAFSKCGIFHRNFEKNF